MQAITHAITHNHNCSLTPYPHTNLCPSLAVSALRWSCSCVFVFMQFLRWINALTAVLYNYAQNVLIFPPFCIEFKSPTYRAFPVFLEPCFPWPPFYVSSWVLCRINMNKGDNCLWVSLEPQHISSSIHPSVVTVSPLKKDKINGQKASWGQRFPCRASLML